MLNAACRAAYDAMMRFDDDVDDARTQQWEADVLRRLRPLALDARRHVAAIALHVTRARLRRRLLALASPFPIAVRLRLAAALFCFALGRTSPMMKTETCRLAVAVA